jgi:hypothetical protein
MEVVALQAKVKLVSLSQAEYLQARRSIYSLLELSQQVNENERARIASFARRERNEASAYAEEHCTQHRLDKAMPEQQFVTFGANQWSLDEAVRVADERGDIPSNALQPPSQPLQPPNALQPPSQQSQPTQQSQPSQSSQLEQSTQARKRRASADENSVQVCPSKAKRASKTQEVDMLLCDCGCEMDRGPFVANCSKCKKAVITRNCEAWKMKCVGCRKKGLGPNRPVRLDPDAVRLHALFYLFLSQTIHFSL